MTRIRVALVLPAVAVVCVAETWRRGLAAPLAFGVRLWTSAAHIGCATADTEDDVIA